MTLPQLECEKLKASSQSQRWKTDTMFYDWRASQNWRASRILSVCFLVVFGVLPSGGDSVKQRPPADGPPNHQA